MAGVPNMFGNPDGSAMTADDMVALIVRLGTTEDIDTAFAHLARLPDHKWEVADKLEDYICKCAYYCWQAWYVFNQTSTSEEEKLKLRHKLGVLKPAACMLGHIAEVNGDDLQKPLKAFLDKFYWEDGRIDLAEKEKRFGEVLAFAETLPSTALSLGIPDKTVTDIFSIFYDTDAAKAIARLEASNDIPRARLIAACEERFIRGIISYPGGNVASSSLHKHLAFSQYIAEARGTAAVPMLRAYIDIVSGMPKDDGSNYHPGALLRAVESHAIAITSQQKLKQLAVARKARRIGLGV